MVFTLEKISRRTIKCELIDFDIENLQYVDALSIVTSSTMMQLVLNFINFNYKENGETKSLKSMKMETIQCSGCPSDINANDMAKQSSYGGEILITDNLENKIRFMCSRLPDNEWSGVLFYKSR